MTAKGRNFTSRFIQPGIAGYPGQLGNALIRKESFDKFIHTLSGKPVIINHQEVTAENREDIEVGTVENVWFNPQDGWYWCDGYIKDETAQGLINDKKWSVSCSYNILLADDEGGTENNVKYDIEILNGEFTHLALVNNPRYERANIVLNSKTVIKNFNPEQKRDKFGKWVKDDAVIQAKKDKLLPVKIVTDNLPENRKDISDWVIAMFDELGSVTIQDTGVTIDLSHESAERETIKRRVKKPENKAVYSEFQELVEKAIKIDERKKDDRHNRNQEVYYNKFQFGNADYEMELFVDEPYISDVSYNKSNKIQNEMVSRDTWGVERIPNTKDTINSIIPNSETKFKGDDMEVNNEKKQENETDKKIENQLSEIIENAKDTITKSDLPLLKGLEKILGE